MHLRLLLATILALPTLSATTIAYNDVLPALPGAQGWLVYGNNSALVGGAATQTLALGGTSLVTDNAVSAGYANRLPILNTLVNAGFPALNRATGYSLHFELQVNSETHTTNDRAGFSVILLSQDLFGIELGFWTNEVWAQSGPAFSHAEGVAFNTTAQQVPYELRVSGANYTLFASGSQILAGALRDYSTFGTPYNLPSFLFLGDDTSSAGANVLLGSVSIAEVPESATWAMAGLGLVAIGGFRRRR